MLRSNDDEIWANLSSICCVEDYNIPGVTIDQVNYTIAEHVTVEYWLVKWVNRYFPLLSLIFVIFSLLFTLLFTHSEWKKTGRWVKGIEEELQHVGKEIHQFRLPPLPSAELEQIKNIKEELHDIANEVRRFQPPNK